MGTLRTFNCYIQKKKKKKKKQPSRTSDHTHHTQKKKKKKKEENSRGGTSGLLKDQRQGQRLQGEAAHGEPQGIGLGSA